MPQPLEQTTKTKISVVRDRDKSSTRFGTGALAAVSALMLLFLMLPIAALALRSFQAWQLLPTALIFDAIELSLWTTAFTVAATLLLGTPLAYVLARWQFRWKSLVNLIVELPIVLPPAVAGLALLITFGRRGLFGPLLDDFGISLPFTTAAVILAQTFVAAPFYIRAAVIGFQNIPPELEEAAQVDGATGLQVFFYVTLPIAHRALIAGLILCWARAIGEFGATILFAGNLQGKTQTMPLLVYNMLERDINAAILTGFLLVVIALVAMLIAQQLQRKNNET
jgi:molybdate transport system permease protein